MNHLLGGSVVVPLTTTYMWAKYLAKYKVAKSLVRIPIIFFYSKGYMLSFLEISMEKLVCDFCTQCTFWTIQPSPPSRVISHWNERLRHQINT